VCPKAVCLFLVATSGQRRQAESPEGWFEHNLQGIDLTISGGLIACPYSITALPQLNVLHRCESRLEIVGVILPSW